MESLWRGFESRPNDPVLFARLRESLEQEGDFAGLTDLYTRRAEAVGGEEAVFLYLTVAEVWSQQDDDTHARKAYRRIMSLLDGFDQETRGQIRQALEELCWARGDWSNLCELARAEAESATTSADRARAWLKLGELSHTRLHDIPAAAEAYRQAAEEPQGGRREQARKALRALSLDHPGDDRVFEALSAVLRAGLPQKEDAHGLIELLQRRLDSLGDRPDPRSEAKLLLEMGEVGAIALDKPERPVAWLERAYQAGADVRAVSDALGALIDRTGDEPAALGLLRELLMEQRAWRDAVSVGEREATASHSDAARANILIELADIEREQLSDPDAASALLDQAFTEDSAQADLILERLHILLDRDPQHAPTIQVLKAIHRAQEQFEPLLELLEKEEARERDNERRAALLVEMARISAGPMGRPDRALEHYEVASGLAQDAVTPIMDGLLELYRQGYYLNRIKALLHTICQRSSQWEVLIDLYELSLDGAASEAEQGALHFELGQILEQEVGDHERAMHHYQQAFQRAPERPQYIEAGRDLYRRMDNMEMVAHLYDVQLQVTEDPEAAAGLLLAKSRVLVDDVGDKARAIEALSRAIGLAPDSSDARALLLELVRSEDGGEALATLEEAYTEADRPDEAAWIHVAIADVVRDELGAMTPSSPRFDDTLREANDFDLSALRLDANHAVLDRVAERLEEGLTAQERWGELVGLIDQRATLEPNPEARVAMLTRMGQLAHDKEGDAATAARAYRTILDLNPERSDVFERLTVLLTETDEAEELETLYRWALDHAPWLHPRNHTAERAQLLLEFAALQGRRGLQRAERDLMMQLSELQPNHDAVRAYFEARVEAEGGALELFRVLERGLAHLTEPDERAERHIELAQLALERVGDPQLAIDQHAAIVEMPGVSPEHVSQARERLRGLYRDEGQLDSLVEMIEGEIRDPNTEPARQLGCLAELIDLHEDERQDLPAARATLELLIERTPKDAAPRLRLANVSGRMNDHDGEASALLALLELAEAQGDDFEVTSRAGERRSRGDLTLRRARLMVVMERLEDATAHYDALLTDQEHRDEALEQIQRLLLQVRDLERLMQVLDREAERTEDSEEAIRFIARMAMFAEQELQDPERAIAQWNRVLQINAHDPMALQALEMLYEQQKDQERLIATCAARLESVEEPQARLRLYRKISRVHRQNEHIDDAKAILRKLLDEFPDDILARQELYEIHLNAEEWEQLMSVNDELLKLDLEPGRRHELLHEQARLAEERLDDPALATERLEALVSEHPDDREALTRLVALLRQQERWSEAADAQERRIHHEVDDPIALITELAALQREQLDDAAAAARTLTRVLAIDPTHRDTLLQLETLYEQLEDHEALVNTRFQLLDLTEDPQEELERLLALAQVLETGQARHAEAFGCLTVVHEKFPDEPTHNDEMFRLAEEHSLWPLMLEVMTEDAARAASLDDRLAIMMRMARLVEERMEAPSDAFEIYAECFAHQPERGEPLREMERLARLDAQRWPRVLACYEQLVDRTVDLEVVVQLFWAMAALQRDEVGDARAAFETLKRALDMGLDEEKTLEQMHALADTADLWSDLVAVYDQRWAELDGFPEEQIPILADTAELILEHLNTPGQAVDRYARAFQLNPWNEPIRERLHALVAQQESWPLLLDLYESAIEASYQRDDVPSQVKFLGHIADVHQEAHDDHDRAFDALTRAFHISPADLPMRQRLEEVGEAANRLGEVAQAYRDMADQSPQSIALVFLLAAARILDEHQGQSIEAIGVLREAMNMDSDNEEVQDRMEALLREQNDVESLIDLYIQRSERSVDRQARYEAYLQVAELMAESNDPDRAVEYFRRALRLEPRNLAIYDALVTLHERLEQHEHTARTLEQIIEVTPEGDTARLVSCYDRLGELYVALNRPARAIEALRKLLELRPGRLDAVDRLEAIMRETNRLDDLVRLFQARVGEIDGLIEELHRLDDEPARPQAAEEDADAEGDEEGAEPTEAQEGSEQVEAPEDTEGEDTEGDDAQESDAPSGAPPESPETIDDAEIAASSDESGSSEPEEEEAAEPQSAPLPEDPRLRLMDAHGELLRVEQLRLRQQKHMRATVDLAVGPLSNPRLAIEVLSHQIERDSENVAAIEQLADLYASLGRWQDHIDTLQMRLDRSENTQTRALILRQIAEVQEEQIHQPARATQTLTKLVEEHPDDAPALADLARLHARQEEWEIAVARYDQACALEGDVALPPSLRADFLFRAGEILEERLERPEEARARYLGAHEADATHADARAALIRTLEGTERWELRAELLEIERERVPEPRQRAELSWQLGTVWRDHDRPEEAADAFRAALQEEPDNLSALRDLGDLAIHTEDWATANDIYAELLSGEVSRMAMEAHKLSEERLLPYEDATDPAYVTYMTRAAMALEAYGDRELAIERYSQALRVRSNNLMALLGLGRHAVEEEDWPTATRHLSKALKQHEEAMSPGDRAQSLLGLATAYHAQRKHTQALEHLEQALEQAPEEVASHRLGLAIAEALEDHAAAMRHLGILIAGADPEERFELLLHKGRLCTEHLDDPAGALEAYTAALQIEPGHLQLLETTLQLHMRLEQWEEADAAVRRLIERDDALRGELGDDPVWLERAVKHQLARGNIQEKGLGDLEEAQFTYELALELNPDDPEPLERLSLLLGRQGEFAELYALYANQLERFEERDSRGRAALLRRLAALLRDELGATPQALETYLKVRDIRPNDVETHEALLSILLTEEHFQPREAMTSLQELLQLTELNEERLRQLLAFYTLLRHDDGIRQIMKMLDFCRCLSREESQQLRRTPDPVPTPQTGELTGQAYELYVRPNESHGALAELMAFVVTELTGAVYQSVVEHDVSTGDLISDAKGMSAASTFRDLRSVLGLEHVELYLKKGGFKGIQIVMSRPPAIIIGEDVFKGMFNKEQRFVLGRALELTRPEYILTEAYSPFDFLTLFEALFERGDVEERGRFDEGMQARIRGWHERLNEVLTPEREVRLLTLVAAIHKKLSDRPSAPQWRRIAQASSLRVGLMLAGDLQVAVKRLMREEERIQIPTIRKCSDLQSAMDTSRDLRELMRYALSVDFIAARDMLAQGVAADTPPSEPPDALRDLYARHHDDDLPAAPAPDDAGAEEREDEGASPPDAGAEPDDAEQNEIVIYDDEDNEDEDIEGDVHEASVELIDASPEATDSASDAPPTEDATQPEAGDASGDAEATDKEDAEPDVIEVSEDEIAEVIEVSDAEVIEVVESAPHPPEAERDEDEESVEDAVAEDEGAPAEEAPSIDSDEGDDEDEAIVIDDDDALIVDEDAWVVPDVPPPPRAMPAFGVAGEDEVTSVIIGDEDIEVLQAPPPPPPGDGE